MDPMLPFLTPNLFPFLPILFRDQLFQVCLIYLDLHHLYLKLNLLLVTLILTEWRGELTVMWRE